MKDAITYQFGSAERYHAVAKALRAAGIKIASVAFNGVGTIKVLDDTPYNVCDKIREQALETLR